MFSEWLGDEDELFDFVLAPFQQQQTIMQQGKLLVNVNPASLLCSTTTTVDHNTKTKTNRRRKLSSFNYNMEESPKDIFKKIIHRDVERQRRLEMAGLYQNLRSQIPSQHLEGKRSISDHIHGTVKYIMHMKNKIDKLNNKRDKLKELLNNPSNSSEVVADQKQCSEGCDHQQPNITVKTCRAGIEITVDIGMKGNLALSKILNILISEGMSIKSCTSTRSNERLLHIIESEVNEEKITDPNELYKKLMMGIARNQ